ncbi:actin [Cladorrhinum sp. PSN332]|nr:actin [Cladorrhinum sp. PSN332]
MSSDLREPALVFDHGSHTIKAGLCLDNTPSVILPTSHATSDREQPYHSAYDSLSLSDKSASHPVVLATDISTTYAELAKTASVFFNTFGSPSLLLEKSHLLSLYSVGRSNGISVDSGYEKTRIVQVWQGFVLNYTATTVAKGGKTVDDKLSELIRDTAQGVESEVLDDIKESCCFVDVGDGNSGGEKEYELPDGNVLKLGAGGWANTTEGLFRSDGQGLGVAEAARQTIGKCDDDLRAGMYGQVVLSGGNTMLPGYAARLQKELENGAPAGVRVNVIASPARKYAAWVGGAIAGRDSTVMKHMAVTRAEYEETGDAIIRRKFIGYS